MDFNKIVEEKIEKLHQKSYSLMQLRDNYKKLWTDEDNLLRINNLEHNLYNSDPCYSKILNFFNNFKIDSKEFIYTREFFKLFLKRKMTFNQYSFLEKVSEKEFKKLAKRCKGYTVDDMIYSYKNKF